MKLRTYRDDLIAQGSHGWDLMEAMTTLNLEHKISVFQSQQQHQQHNNSSSISNSSSTSSRCPHCWHNSNSCICCDLPKLSHLERLMLTMEDHNDGYRVKFLIVMHSKEYLSAGNSAKLILSLLPNHSELFLFGKRGEMDRLLSITTDTETDWNDGTGSSCSTRTMILWPDKNARSVHEFCQDAIGGKSISSTATTTSRILQVIVLDGTYSQARNMLHSLRKRWKEKDKPLPKIVQLRPTTNSVFHRAQKNYGKAHRQQQQQEDNDCNEDNTATTNNSRKQPLAMRISTAEACGVLLMELGMPQEIQDCIVQAVVVNNKALNYARRSDEIHHGESK